MEDLSRKTVIFKPVSSETTKDCCELDIGIQIPHPTQLWFHPQRVASLRFMPLHSLQCMCLKVQCILQVNFDTAVIAGVALAQVTFIGQCNYTKENKKIS